MNFAYTISQEKFIVPLLFERQACQDKTNLLVRNELKSRSVTVQVISILIQ